MRTFRIAIIVAFLTLCSQSLACDYPIPISFHQHFSQSKYIFIFRLESLALANRMDGRVTGQIKILRTLRGATPKYRYVTFRSSDCGGNRLDVGHYLFAMASQDGKTLILESAARSIIDLRWQYSEYYSDALNDKQYFLSAIHRYLAGAKIPNDFPSTETLQFTQYTAPPPVPGEPR